MKPVKVAIVDDHTLFRQGIAALIAVSPDIEIIFDAENGQDMIHQLGLGKLPDVILADINMPEMDGYQTTAWLKINHPGIRVLALSMFEDDCSIIGMLRQGAGGYLLKESRGSELILAIKTIASDGFYLNSQVSGKMLRSIQNPESGRSGNNFSDNEKKFLELCCSDLTYKEIADLMHLSPHTIDNYRESFFERFAIRSRTGLVIYAIKNKLVTL